MIMIIISVETIRTRKVRIIKERKKGTFRSPSSLLVAQGLPDYTKQVLRLLKGRYIDIVGYNF